MVEEHGADMSARDKRDARRVQATFEFEEVPGSGRTRAGGTRRDHEPPPHQRQPPTAAPPAQPARPPGPGRRREPFGGSLTVEGGSGSGTPRVSAAQSRTPTPPRGDVEPATLEYVCSSSHLWRRTDKGIVGDMLRLSKDWQLSPRTRTVLSQSSKPRFVVTELLRRVPEI